MRKRSNNTEIRRQNRSRTAQFVLERGSVSRNELALSLELSLPTVFQNVNELLEMGLLCESGEYESTGGRKAKMLSINPAFGNVVGVEISRTHIGMVLTDVSGSMHAQSEIPCAYMDTDAYYRKLGEELRLFLTSNGVDAAGLIGVGISLPGILNKQLGILQKSYILNVMDISLQKFKDYLPFPTCFNNDATNAACAEIRDRNRDAVYLSLNETVGGAICIGGELYDGDNFKSAEFGHIVIRPGGRRCYCGKIGCVDAYCAAAVLSPDGSKGLRDFFAELDDGNPKRQRQWSDYLEDLAITVTNLRTAFDCDIIVGGDVGGYLAERLHDLYPLLGYYHKLDFDSSYLKVGRYKCQSSALGAAWQMTEQFLQNLT